MTKNTTNTFGLFILLPNLAMFSSFMPQCVYFPRFCPTSLPKQRKCAERLFPSGQPLFDLYYDSGCGFAGGVTRCGAQFSLSSAPP